MGFFPEAAIEGMHRRWENERQKPVEMSLQASKYADWQFQALVSEIGSVDDPIDKMRANLIMQDKAVKQIAWHMDDASMAEMHETLGRFIHRAGIVPVAKATEHLVEEYVGRILLIDGNEVRFVLEPRQGKGELERGSWPLSEFARLGIGLHDLFVVRVVRTTRGSAVHFERML